jgi:EAL domain-containing protein (putative c-di-GMP-specific phosphodiesterase class I)
LLAAEAALRRAKVDGGSQVVLFHPSMRRQSRRPYDIEQALLGAVRDGSVTVHYQPVFGTDEEGIVGFEALARWTDPRLGPVSPDEFIPVAEATGMIHELGAVVLERALRDAAQWPLRPDGRPYTVAVNVSWMQLARPGFSSLLASALNATRVDPDQVCIELTETAITDSMDLVSASLLLIRTMGVHVAIDDFGIGHATLRYVTQLPIDAVKLDRTFVMNVDTDERPRSVVAAVVAMAASRGLRLVAEGVETQAQLAALRELGVRQVQGFLLGVPAPVEQVLDLLGQSARPLRAVPPWVVHPVIPPKQRRPAGGEAVLRRPG